MSNIVEKLRASSVYSKGAMPLDGNCIFSEAATEIERLRAALDEIAIQGPKRVIKIARDALAHS